jgi:tetratricopeptide (TPR) repeat protein
LFDAAACDVVYHHSRGIPRLINLLCDTALIYGFAEKEQRIGAGLVNEVAADKLKGGIFPAKSQDGRNAEEFEPQDAHLAAKLNNLALAYKALGRFAEAEPLYKRALAIAQKALGPEHPHVVTSLRSLAELEAKMRSTGISKLEDSTTALTDRAEGVLRESNKPPMDDQVRPQGSSATLRAGPKK